MWPSSLSDSNQIDARPGSEGTPTCPMKLRMSRYEAGRRVGRRSAGFREAASPIGSVR